MSTEYLAESTKPREEWHYVSVVESNVMAHCTVFLVKLLVGLFVCFLQILPKSEMI